jgi:diguanylate cyclase (GGDEF)-like protein
VRPREGIAAPNTRACPVRLERAILAVDRAVSRLSRGQVFAVALLGVGVIGVPDYLVGSEISLSLFYLFPIGIATWYAGGGAGMAIVLISTFAALAGEIGAGNFVLRPWIVAWNGVLRLGFMLVVALLVDRLRVHLAIERRLARSDPLTGILNARAFTEQLQFRLDLAAREGNPISLAYVDLDDLKRLNDRGGHAEGDRILRLVASTLTESIRVTDELGRLGGDEFALLIGGADRPAAERVVAKVRNALLQAFGRERSSVTCSIGCVTFHAPPPSAKDAIGAADSLMYDVKRHGKNAVAFEAYPGQPVPYTRLGTAADAPTAERH